MEEEVAGVDTSQITGKSIGLLISWSCVENSVIAAFVILPEMAEGGSTFVVEQRKEGGPSGSYPLLMGNP